MIKYNLNTINDWNFGDNNIIKVYKHGAVCYYKITSGDTPTPVQEPCFAVVDDITQYSDTEFEDVYDKATEKWYKLNNLNEYEEYGVYGSGRTITTYEGKLTIDTESTPQPSRLPAGYTEVEYIENTGTTSSNGAYINSGLKLYDVVGNSFSLSGRVKSEYYTASGYNDLETIINSESVSSPYYGFTYRYAHSTHTIEVSCTPSNSVSLSSTANSDGSNSIVISCNSTTVTNQVPLGLFASYNANYNTPYRFAKATIYSLTVVKNGETVRDLVPAKRDSDDKYGLYDIITDTFYTSPNGNNFSGGSEVTPPPITATCEFMYSGGSWVNLGEVSGSTQIIKSPEYIAKTSSFNGYCSLLEYFTEDTKIIVKHRQTNAVGGSFIGDYFNNDNDDWRVFFASRTLYYDFITQRKYTSKTIPMSSPEEWEIGNYYIKNTATSTNLITGTHQSFSSRPNEMYLYYLGGFGNVTDYGEVYYVKIYKNDVLVRDFIPWTDMNGNYGLYDKVEGELVHTVGNMTASTVINDVEVGGGYEYPLEYVVREDPPNNLVFSSMTEAEAYECPWVGMNATIDGDNYVFSGDSQSGYEWVYQSSRLPQGYTEVEYVQNTGTSYFDTNFKPNTNTRIVADMQQVTANDFPRLFGCNNFNATAGMNVNYEGGYLQISWFGKTSWTRITSIPNNFDRHVYDLNKNNLYVDETLVASTTYSSSYQSSDNLGIFFEISGGRPGQAAYFTQEAFKGKMYSFQIYDNGTLVRDLVPCIRDNDDTVGAYDIVNDVFYTVPTGYTTDKLIAGNPI